jgi:hypothetical protein
MPDLEFPEPSASTYPGYKSSIQMVNGEMMFDPMVVVKNKNLRPFIDQLRQSRLTLAYSLDGIPPFVQSFLQALSPDKFTIANPGKNWNCCCTRDDSVPNRELVCQGKDKNLFLLAYLTGGIGTSEHLLLIRYTKNKITDFWQGPIVQRPQTKEDIVAYLRSKQINHYDIFDVYNAPD